MKSVIKKKAQEEITGFVLIVVLVMVIFAIILGIMLRKGETGVQKQSEEINQFLSSLMRYTTECEISYASDFRDVKGLASACYLNPAQMCLSGKNACDILNETASGIIKSIWHIGAENKGYVFELTFNAGSRNNTIVKITEGNCTGRSYTYGNYPYLDMTTGLRVCK